MTFKIHDMSLCTESAYSTIHRCCDQGLLAPVAGRKNERINVFDPRQISQFYLLKVLRELGLSSRSLRITGKIAHRNLPPGCLRNTSSG